MVNYRRNKEPSPDALYFLTIVTHRRLPLFRSRDDYLLLWNEMKRVSDEHEADFRAWVLLPDHMHWLLRPGRGDYSKLVASFKRGMGIEHKRLGRLTTGQTLWQDRFWEHTVRDDEELRRCVEYIHYNPVKHGHSNTPRDWPYSSFKKHVDNGLFPPDWGGGQDIVVAGAEWDP